MKLYKYNKNKLLYEETYTPWIWRTLFFISCLFLLSFVVSDKKQSFVSEVIIIEKKPTQEDIFEIIDRYPFEHKDIVKAQVLLETGNLTSASFTKHNNLFGMKVPRQRLTLAVGEGLNHASYRTVEESIIDRLLYESMYFHKLNREQYFSLLDKIYAEDSLYSYKIKNIIKTNFQ